VGTGFLGSKGSPKVLQAHRKTPRERLGSRMKKNRMGSSHKALMAIWGYVRGGY